MDTTKEDVLTIIYPENTKGDEVVRFLMWIPKYLILKTSAKKLRELNRKMENLSGKLAYSGILQGVDENYYSYVDISPVQSLQETKEMAIALAVTLRDCFALQAGMYPCGNFQVMKSLIRKAKLDRPQFLPATVH